MKIIKKAKLPKITCELCGCVFRPEGGDLRSLASGSASLQRIREETFVFCPVCGLSIGVFNKESADAETKD